MRFYPISHLEKIEFSTSLEKQKGSKWENWPIQYERQHSWKWLKIFWIRPGWGVSSSSIYFWKNSDTQNSTFRNIISYDFKSCIWSLIWWKWRWWLFQSCLWCCLLNNFWRDAKWLTWIKLKLNRTEKSCKME